MWIRYNSTLKYYEYSNDNGGAWAQLPLSGAAITEGTIPNVAYKNAANVFTQNQRIQLVSPNLYLWDDAEAADLRAWKIINTAQNLWFQPSSDAGSGLLTAMQMNRSGLVTIPNRLIVSDKLSVGTTVAPSVAGDLVVARSGHTKSGVIYFGANLDGYLYRDTTGNLILIGGPIELSNVVTTVGNINCGGNFHNTAGYVYPGRSDAGGAIQGSWFLSSHASYGLYTNTNLFAAGWYYEASRTTPQGHWISWTPTLTAQAGTWTGSTACAYTLIGNTCICRLSIENGATSASTAWLAATLPITPNGYHQSGDGRIYFPGYGLMSVMAYATVGDARLFIQRDTDQGNVVAYGSGLHVYASIAYQI